MASGRFAWVRKSLHAQCVTKRLYQATPANRVYHAYRPTSSDSIQARRHRAERRLYASRALGRAFGVQAAITTPPPLGYWRARHAACSGAHAREGRTTNTELGGRALRQPTKKPAGRAFRWAVGGASSKFLARHGCAPADTVELAPLVQLDLCIVEVPPLRLSNRLQVLRLHVAVLV